MLINLVQFNVDVTTNSDYPTASGGAPAAILLDQMYGFSIVIKALSGQVGTLKLQVSNDDNTTMLNGTPTWADLANGSFTINGAATQTGNFDAQYYRWLRVDYAKNSGTGLIAVQINVKGP